MHFPVEQMSGIVTGSLLQAFKRIYQWEDPCTRIAYCGKIFLEACLEPLFSKISCPEMWVACRCKLDLHTDEGARGSKSCLLGWRASNKGTNSWGSNSCSWGPLCLMFGCWKTSVRRRTVFTAECSDLCQESYQLTDRNVLCLSSFKVPDSTDWGKSGNMSDRECTMPITFSTHTADGTSNIGFDQAASQLSLIWWEALMPESQWTSNKWWCDIYA